MYLWLLVGGWKGRLLQWLIAQSRPQQPTYSLCPTPVSTTISSRPLPLPLGAMGDNDNREALVGVTSCVSCQICSTITQIFRTLSIKGSFENHDSTISRGTVISQIIQAGDSDWDFEGWRSGGDLWTTHIDWETLSCRTAAGCPTCRVIRDAILVFLSDDNFKGEDRPQLAVGLWCGPDETLSVDIWVAHVEIRGGTYIVRLYRDQRTDAFLWPLPSIPTHWHNESRDDKISKIKLWMKQCFEEHADCKTTPGGSMGMDMLLPKRVVDVSPPTSAGEDIRLHECSDGEVGTYVCLSHCWGDFQPLQTTRENLHTWRANIPWAQVPQTFRDAIFVTRRLGFRFLWIDSLCIVQDDKQDWEEQAPLMWSIYSNAMLTLAATRCGDCRDTLLPQFQRTVHGHSATGHSIALAARIHDDYLTADHLRSPNYPLLSRAWVFQERLISRRIVHFAHDELFWECMEDTTCECSLLNQRPGGTKSARYRAGKLPLAEKSLQMIWYELVEQYARLRLTFASDRAAALQGLAEEMRQHRKSEYTCGIWHDSLLADLAWSVTDPPTREKEWASVAEGSLPSWSWCSVNTRCDYRLLVDRGWEDHDDAKVLSVSAPVSARSTSTADVSGSSRAGCIALDCRLFDLHLEEILPRSWIFFPDYNWSLPPGGTEALHFLALGTLRPITLRSDFVCYVGILLRCVDRRQGLYKRLGLLILIPVTKHGGTTSPGSKEMTSETSLPWGGGLLGDGRATTVNLV